MFVIVKDDYEGHLRNTDLADIVEEYVTNAPVSNKANKASSPHRKFHGVTTRTLKEEEIAFYADELSKSDGLYRKQLLETDGAYFDHPKTSQGALYEYSSDALSDDIFVSYKSKLYPWIDSAGFYTHNTHLPRDFDAVNLVINGRDGEGHLQGGAALLHRRPRAGDEGHRDGPVDLLHRHHHLQEVAGAARPRCRTAGRPHHGRNRCAVSRARQVARG